MKMFSSLSVLFSSESNSIVMQRNSELTYDGITEHIIINEFDLYDNLYTYINNILKNVIII